MRFHDLTIRNLRCLQHVEFSPAAGLSLVWGANGSGKTSVLEAFALASLGKSFLSNRVSDIVRMGTDALSVLATLEEGSSGKFSVSVRKARGETLIHMDGLPVKAASELAQRIPLLVINSKAADILTESPSNRRALVDRTLFHVEHSYVDAWRQYRQALRQRNELLRRQAPRREAEYWHEQIDAVASAIDRQRSSLVEQLNATLRDVRLAGVEGQLSLAYSPGWKTDSTLKEQLAESWERDIRLGYTSKGVHRADLALKAGEHLVGRRLSRGQAKFVVVNVYAALARFIQETGGSHPVLLVDDLAAELDDKMRAAAVDIIRGLDGQQVFTATRPTDLSDVADTAQCMFHVEQHTQGAMA
ncbi:MAG: DNA replication/repair protein RecF [Gammaproteobacteria bacterium]